jgi:hypothetical protein
VATKKVEFVNDVHIIFGVEVGTNLLQLYIPTNKQNQSISFPELKGATVEIQTLLNYTDMHYVAIKENAGTDDELFYVIANDIQESIAKLDSVKYCIQTVINKLNEWKDFFSSGKSLMLSEEQEIGLAGELMLLEDLINTYGTKAQTWWAGAGKETHDFYINKNAIEVKSTIKQAPYSAQIHSEYQLDDNDVEGLLYLKFYALRRSKSSGIKIPEIISNILKLLDSDMVAITEFKKKLQQYGYYEGIEEKYNNGFFKRDEYLFQIREGFPRIIRKQLPSVIWDINYALNISDCTKYMIDNNIVYKLTGGQ